MIRPYTPTPSLTRLISIGILLSGVLAVQSSAQTSNPNSGSTPSGLKPGSPSGSYSLSGFDNVNLYNGNLSFHLPLLGIGGRGDAKTQMMLAIDSVHWTVDTEVDSGLETYGANPNWWGGLKVGYGPGVLQGRQVNWRYLQSPNGRITVTRLTFTAADGTEYELRDALRNGEPYTGTPSSRNRGKVWVSTDGSSVTFISDIDITDYSAPNGEDGYIYPTGYLFLSDGTRYRIGNTGGAQAGLVTKIRDRNGNELSFTYDTNNRVETITDSLNRQITISYDLVDPLKQRYTYDEISYKGFGGTPRSLKVWRTNLGRVLRSDSDYVAKSYHDLFPDLGGSSTLFNPSNIASSVELPDGRTYELRYNPWGELARVVLPTGGAIEYDYTNYPGTGLKQDIHRRVTARRVYSDGATNTLESRQAYSHSYSLNPNRAEVLVKQYGATNNLLAQDRHYFAGHPQESLSISPWDNGLWSDGREDKTESLSLSDPNPTVLHKVEQTWQQSGNSGLNIWWQNGLNNGPSMNPRVVETVTTLMDSSPNKVAKQTAINPVNPTVVGFDQYNNQTDSWETDYGNGAPGVWLRHAHTDYLTTQTVNGTTYNYDTIAGTSSSPDVANTIHLRRLVKEQLVYAVNSTTGADAATAAADTRFYYDQTSLKPYSGISGHDSAYTDSYRTRGNLTRASRWRDLPTTAWLNADQEYDIAGNVWRSTDARGNAISFDYTDCFGAPNGEARSDTAPSELGTQHGYAFVTSVANALSQTSYAQYDFYLGLPVDGEDINGVVASGYYTNTQGQTDPLDRPFKVVTAVGTSVQSQTSFSYNDAARIVTVTSDRAAYNDNALKTETFYDRLGRTTETHTYETASSYVISKQEYDALGRVKRTYNPYRTTSDPTYGSIENTYDALGRVTVVTASDNTQVTTVYDNNRVTVTDPAGKTRRSITDGLGRLMQVVEDPNGLNYSTNYLYDILGNLRRVEQASATQGTQYRYFLYDSLSRLVRAKMPEQDANGAMAPTLTDPLTNQSAWAAAYNYDANGNLETRTDARNIVTSYAYDALNRNTTVTYSANANTPNITNRYDNASLTYGKGRLWQTETAGSEGTLWTINSFDALGRTLSQSQQFKTGNAWSTAYTAQQAYNITGNISSETYPSGHTVAYTYDNAARLSVFSGNLGDGATRTYASNFVYDEGGRLLEERYGMQTALYHKLRYNVRGQLYDVRLSTVSRAIDSTDWDRGCLAFYYSANNPTWGSSGTDNNGDVRQAEMYVPNGDGSYNMLRELYTYDSLNRLQAVTEYQWGSQFVFTQGYDYDRWGNRTLNSSTSSTVNHQPFTVNTSNNRLGVPTNQTGQMTYDAAGNLTADTYSRADTSRTYDGENRLAANTNNSQEVSRYTYDSSGRRVRRNVNNQETWQVYGIGGELIAEYAANASPSSVQKEYGYRNGELLVTATSTAGIQWLIGDHLGTPRIIADQTGSLSGIKRHDYLPFGEEIFAGAGGRTMTQGYLTDNVRQKFTKYERDSETNLDFAEARYFSSTQGRFTSIDPLSASMRASDPQSFNRYSYVGNNPVNWIDPSGMDWENNAAKQAASMHYLDQMGTLSLTPTTLHGDSGEFYAPPITNDAEEDVEEEATNTVGEGVDQNAQNMQPATEGITPTTPLALQVLSIEVLQICKKGNNDCGNPVNSPHGIALGITYQVTGMEGALRQGDLIPYEKISPTRIETEIQTSTLGSSEGKLGPSRNSQNTGKTNAQGQFIDSPVAISGPSFIRKATATQRIYFKVGGLKYFVRENKFTLTGTQDKKNKLFIYTITNGSDITATFRIPYK